MEVKTKERVYKPQPDGLESERCRIKHLWLRLQEFHLKVSEKAHHAVAQGPPGIKGLWSESLTAVGNTLSAALRQARPEAGGVLSWELTRWCHQAPGSGIKLLPSSKLLPQIFAYMGERWQPLPPARWKPHTCGMLRALWASVHTACAAVRMWYIYVCTCVYIHMCAYMYVCVQDIYVCIWHAYVCQRCIHTA